MSSLKQKAAWRSAIQEWVGVKFESMTLVIQYYYEFNLHKTWNKKSDSFSRQWLMNDDYSRTWDSKCLLKLFQLKLESLYRAYISWFKRYYGKLKWNDVRDKSFRNLVLDVWTIGLKTAKIEGSISNFVCDLSETFTFGLGMKYEIFTSQLGFFLWFQIWSKSTNDWRLLQSPGNWHSVCDKRFGSRQMGDSERPGGNQS